MENISAHVMSYSRWLQYVHLNFPGLRLSVLKQDVCDACIRIDIRLKDESLSETEHQAIVDEKNMHIQAAVKQHRTMSLFVKEFIQKVDPNQELPEKILLELIDENESIDNLALNSSSPTVPTVLIQAEDFGVELPYLTLVLKVQQMTISIAI
ncbi:hypothetical protein HK096_010210 [Nowakowskiella sp. JEL0078]|nr:hypothetical protein HK096_010210 [Nowakowskiella sp. JEL0078]